MVIRVKGKQLVTFGVILLMIALIMLHFGGFLLYRYATILDAIGYSENANVYYARVSEQFGYNKSGLQAESKRVQNILKKGNFTYSNMFINVMGHFISTNGYIGYKTVDSVNERYDSLKKNTLHQHLYDEYTLGVALVNWFGGNTDKALGILTRFQSKSERLEVLGKLHLASMYFYLGELEESQRILSEITPKTELLPYKEDIMALNLAFTGFFNEDYIKNRGNHSTSTSNYLTAPFNYSSYLVETLHAFKQDAPQATGNKVTGRITVQEGQGKNLMVFVKNAEYKNSWRSMISKSDDLVGLGITNEDGYFEINHIPDGVYGLILYIPWHRISGRNILYHTEYSLVFEGNTHRTENIAIIDPVNVTVTEKQKGILEFSWDHSKLDIDSYTLSISELVDGEDRSFPSNNQLYIRNITDNHITVDVGLLQKSAYSNSFSFGWQPDPRQYIEPLYPSGRYTFSLTVNPNRNMLLNTSLGIYPNKPPEEIWIDGNEWTFEDLLLLKGKLEKARLAYEALLEKDPNNIHALKVLSRMYTYGYIAPEGEIDSARLDGVDDVRALELLERLDVLIDSNDIKTALANQYTRVRAYEKAISLTETLQMRDFSIYNTLQIGRLYLYMGEYDKSVEYFKAYAKETGSIDYLLLMGILSHNEDWMSEAVSLYTRTSIDLLDWWEDYQRINKSEYLEFFDLVRSSKADEAHKWLEGRMGEMDLFFKAMLYLTQNSYGVSFEELDTAYRAFHSHIKNPALEGIMTYMGRSFINSSYGTLLDMKR